MPSLGNGSTCCDGLSVLAGGKIPPYGTHTFCISDFLLEFLFLALLSEYLAFHYAAKCGGIGGARALLSVPAPAVGRCGVPGHPRLVSGTVPADVRPVFQAHRSGRVAVPVEAAGAVGLSLG